MGFNTVVFAEGLVEVQLRAANSDVNAAVVESRHRVGRKGYIVWQGETVEKLDDTRSRQDCKMHSSSIIVTELEKQKLIMKNESLQ